LDITFGLILVAVLTRHSSLTLRNLFRFNEGQHTAERRIGQRGVSNQVYAVYRELQFNIITTSYHHI